MGHYFNKQMVDWDRLKILWKSKPQHYTDSTTEICCARRVNVYCTVHICASCVIHISIVVLSLLGHPTFLRPAAGWLVTYWCRIHCTVLSILLSSPWYCTSSVQVCNTLYTLYVYCIRIGYSIAITNLPLTD